MALTAKQHAFVEEYLVDMNATQAAIRAGYSPKTAYNIGSENLAKPEIAAALEKARAERSERTEITADWILNMLRENAEEAKAAGDRAPCNRALELLGKHVGMFKDDAAVVVNTVAPGTQPLDGDALAALLTAEDKADEVPEVSH